MTRASYKQLVLHSEPISGSTLPLPVGETLRPKSGGMREVDMLFQEETKVIRNEQLKSNLLPTCFL